MTSAILEQTASDLNVVLKDRNVSPFAAVDEITVHFRQLADGAAAREIIKTMARDCTAGWAVSLSPQGSQIVMAGSKSWPPAGYVSECEAVLNDGRTLMIRQGNGTLGAWLYGASTPPSGEWNDVSLRPEGGLLVQDQITLGTPGTPGRIKHQVYWRDFPSFGLRPVAAVFAGFEQG